MARREALPAWPLNSPVAVIAWGYHRGYAPTPMNVSGVSMRNPGDLALYFLARRSPIAVQWHNLLLGLPRDPAQAKTTKGRTGTDPHVMGSVFGQQECGRVCAGILAWPSHVVMPAPSFIVHKHI